MEPATGFGFEQCVVTHPGEHGLWLTKYSYTRSGGASICTDARTGSAVMRFGLYDVLEPLKLRGPELGEEVSQRVEPFGPHHI